MAKRDEILQGTDEYTQAVRILDVVALGPLMIWAGAKAKNDLPKWARTALVVSGITTIGFNGIRYMAIEDAKAKGALKPPEE